MVLKTNRKVKKMKLPSVDSATWRGLITSVQSLAAFVVTLLLLPGVADIIRDFYPEAVVLVSIAGFLASFFPNLIRKDVKNY